MKSESKVAIVTGGSRGIGRAVVEDLARRGFEVHFTYVKDAAAADSLVERTRALGPAATAARVDARDTRACTDFVDKTIADRGRLDVLVSNAGVVSIRLLAVSSPADWEPVLSTSLNGLFGMAQPAAKHMMKERAGRIISLTSVSGVVGVAGQAAYSAAKAAIIGFTRALSKELASWGVPVNAVAPGYTETDMLSALSQKQRDAALALIPMRRFGTADEIAGVVGYLATDAPQYMTGQVLVVDGGLT
jgi:3-oxoacyl-[acyl-carrier protein] reductase